MPANEADADRDGVRVCEGDCNDSNPIIQTLDYFFHNSIYGLIYGISGIYGGIYGIGTYGGAYGLGTLTYGVTPGSGVYDNIYGWPIGRIYREGSFVGQYGGLWGTSYRSGLTSGLYVGAFGGGLYIANNRLLQHCLK